MSFIDLFGRPSAPCVRPHDDTMRMSTRMGFRRKEVKSYKARTVFFFGNSVGTCYHISLWSIETLYV